MRLLLLTFAAVAGMVRASETAPSRAGGARADPPADTILRRDLLAPRPLGPPPWSPGRPRPPSVRLGLAPRLLEVPALGDSLPDLAARLPWTRARVVLPEVREPWVVAADPWVTEAVARFLDARARAAAAAPGDRPFLPAETVAPRPTPAVLPPGAEELPGIVNRYAELGVRVRGRAELGGDWTRYRPCLGQFQESCTPTLLPQLEPDLNMAVQVAGTVADRVHVNVDYDQMREFGAANTISIVYEGLEDDVLSSVEVGDVTFRLPRSRFLTQGIPAGNFGFQARGQLGPVELRSVWAQQTGDLSSREFRLTGVGNQRRFVQEDTLELDDADYAQGQFFFLVDPEAIAEYPHLDVLDLDAGAAPASLVPGIEPIQLYRFDNDPAARQQVEGYIQADAVAEADGERVFESGWFRYLIPGQDYFVHPSGLWIALRTPLSRDEMLAVTYVTALGDTVGTYNPERVYTAGERPELRLLKASGANHQPGRPTWEQEMHQVYRVSAAPDVEPASVDVTISLGEPSAGRTFRRAPDGRDVTFLQLFGLDQESPIDRIDPAYVYAPAEDRFFQETAGVQGAFVIFPTLRPFLEPPPNEGLALTAEETAELLADDANERIYESGDPYEREAGGRFRLTVPYRRRSEGVISSFSLGALGIVDESERILLGDRPLVRGVDYEIDYDVGQVTLLDPEALFAATPDAPVRATWEQKQVFREAPTSVFGFNAHVGDDDSGRLDLLTLYRSEKTLVTRPVLGLEPEAALMGGLSGRVESGMRWMDGVLGAIPGLRANEESAFSLEGELAVSLPNPNTRGDVFLDDFDASDARPLSLLSHDWTRGSAPAFPDGAEIELPGALDERTLADLAWQHTWIEEAFGDSVGIHEGFLPAEEIDRQIRVAGARVREPGLRLTFAGPPTNERRWASITTTLSPTGTDLTKSEFIEFYVADGTDLTLVVDLGMVSEDAFFVDPQRRTSGVKPNGVPWGLGLLDQEADPARGEIWGNAADELGVWGETCEGEPGAIYRLGDRRANCTRGNGRNDTEDLDGDGNLDTTERSLRYVVRLDGSSPFLARSREETGSQFRLYRIPIRSALATEVNGPVTEGDLRAVRHLRLTVTGSPRSSLTFARMRIVGSRWIKRGIEGVLTGIIGDDLAAGGRVEVGPVSQLSEGAAYASPPGVLEQLADPTSAVGGQGVEFNEKSLSVRVEGIGADERGEVYSRFPQRPRDFLAYREARLWVVAREGAWGPDGPATFFLKIGTDPENFYLYRTPLPAPSGGEVSRDEWLPEVVVDFGVFQELRVRLEQALAREPRGPGDPPLVLWERDSTYAVVLSDQGRAPNLANVRELAFGIWNGGETSFDGEVWINEFRLSRGVRDAGFAGEVRAELRAGDVMDTRIALSSRGAHFRQLDEAATYQTDSRLTVDSRIRLERFTPGGWGVELPLSVSIDRSSLDPTLLADSDVPAERIVGLRETGSSRTRVALGFRKTTPVANPVLGFVLDGLETNVAWYRSRASSVTSRLEANGVDLRVGYDRPVEPREFDPVPGFVEPLVRWLLPGPLEEAVLGTRLRWSPERVAFGASYGRQDNRIFRYDRIIELQSDSLVEATLAPREALEAVAEVGLRPLPSLTADVTFLSTRDLLHPDEVVPDVEVQDLLAGERRRLAGVDLGWETNRSIRTRADYRPRIVSWLRHEVGFSTRYDGDRNPGFVRRVEAGTDTVAILERNASGEREVRTLLALDFGALAGAISGPDDEGRTGVAAVLDRLRPVTWAWSDGIFSRFNRDPVSPGNGYQLGWSGLEGYRVLDGDTAATLVERVSRQVSWGVAGERAGLDATWGESDVVTLDARADRTVRTETWPDVRARLDDLPMAGFLTTALQRVALSAGVRRSRREITYGQAAQRRHLDERSIPMDVTFTWVGGLVTGYRAELETGRGEDPTGDTERDLTRHRLSVTSAFLPPFGLGREVPRPVRLSLLASYVDERECRVPAGRSECVAFVDQINRALSMTLDTQVSDFEVGLVASYVDRQSFVGQQRGSTQFQLSVFGQFLFEAGDVGGEVFGR